MASWQGALLTRLRANAGVTSLIGTKSTWVQMPQGTARPYVTLLDLTPNRPQHLTGYDVEASRVQIDAWGDTPESAAAVMEAVLTALVPGHTTGGHVFQRADVALGPRDVAGERDGTQPVFRKSADLILHHTTA